MPHAGKATPPELLSRRWRWLLARPRLGQKKLLLVVRMHPQHLNNLQPGEASETAWRWRQLQLLLLVLHSHLQPLKHLKLLQLGEAGKPRRWQQLHLLLLVLQ